MRILKNVIFNVWIIFNAKIHTFLSNSKYVPQCRKGLEFMGMPQWINELF